MTQTPLSSQTYPKVARCVCGALQLTVTAAPTHVHACACTRCQRASGSALLWSAWFPESSVTIHGAFTRFYLTDTPDPHLMAGFCDTCGGGRFLRSGDYLKDCIAISAGSFADPAFLAPDHIHWWPDRPHWLGQPHRPTLLPGN